MSNNNFSVKHLSTKDLWRQPGYKCNGFVAGMIAGWDSEVDGGQHVFHHIKVQIVLNMPTFKDEVM